MVLPVATNFKTNDINYFQSPICSKRNSQKIKKSYSDKIKEMTETINDPFFLSDINEIREDFKNIDNQYEL